MYRNSKDYNNNLGFKKREDTNMRLRQYVFLLMMLIISICGVACGSKDDAVKATESIVVDGDDSKTSKPTLEPERITEEEARDIALKHAGHEADKVKGLRTEYELDDGIPEYEITYYFENKEYDYTIHGETGDIISYDWDELAN